MYHNKAAHLIELMHSNNVLTRPLGVNVRHKVQHEPNYRAKALLVLLWIDSLYVMLLAFIPTSNEELLLRSSDMAFMLFNQNRYAFYAVPLFYRVSSAAMVSFFMRSSFHWLVQANAIFERIKSPLLYHRLVAIRKRCQLMAIVVACLRASLILSAHSMAAFLIYRERDSKYFMLPAYLNVLFYAVIYTSLNVQFMVELYFLCRVCTELFCAINRKYSGRLFRLHQLGYWQQYYSEFGSCCILVRHVLSYLSPIYLVYFTCNLIVSVFIMYASLYTAAGSELSTFIYVAFTFVEFLNILVFSQAIGNIDVKAKAIADRVYSEFILNLDNRFTRHFQTKIHRYFQTVWSSNISMVVMGNPINSSTSIKIFTVVLTIMAFLISNLRRN